MASEGVTSPSLMPRKKRKSAPNALLTHGSCVDEMRKLGSNSVHMVLADPPYGVGIAKWDGDSGNMSFAEAWLTEAKRVLRPGGTLLFFSSPCTIWSSRMNVMLEDHIKMEHVQTLSWVYSQGGDARLESMKRYAVRSEIIEWWIKSPGHSTFNPALAAEPYTEDKKREALAKGVGRVSEASLNKGRPPRTWFDIPRENSRSLERQYGKHPCMKPMPLAERLVNVHTNEGDTVLVPFAGSGSELLVAAKLGREAVGFETEDEYVQTIKRRFQGHAVPLTVK